MTLAIIALVIVIACIVSWVSVVQAKKRTSRMAKKLSFKEAMDLAELPVVTFYQKDKRFNFLLDTGSNYSHISGEAAKSIDSTEAPCENVSVSGVGGSNNISHNIIANLSYKDRVYEMELCVGEHLNDVFAEIKSATGVQVHGLIGNQFLQKYKYVLDFEELVAYEK